MITSNLTNFTGSYAFLNCTISKNMCIFLQLYSGFSDFMTIFVHH